MSFEVAEVSYIPSHCIGSSGFRSAEVFTGCPLNQASKINSALSENASHRLRRKHTVNRMQYIFSNVFAIIHPSRSEQKYSNFMAPASLKKNNHGKYRSVHYND